MASTGSGVVKDNHLLDKDKEWLSSLRRRVEGPLIPMPHCEEPCTIFRVPVDIRKRDPDAYEPRVISFGPFWRDNPSLKPMEQHKLRYVQRLLSRNPNVALEHYFKLIRDLEARSRACYSEDIDMESHEFVEMMLLDGCFLVEFLLITCKGDSSSAGNEYEGEEKEMDPVQTKHTLYLIKCDMLLLENQIPFFIIEEVFKLATSGDSNRSSSDYLTNLLWRFFNINPNPSERMPRPLYHVLHFVHSGIMPWASSNMNGRVDTSTQGFWPTRVSNEPPVSVPCATKLMEAGVKFRNQKKADSFLEVAFHKDHNGTMEIPTLLLYNHTNSIFRNLIAFEQCFLIDSGEVGTHVTTYALFMDCLIDSGEDVEMLCRHGCIKNWLGSNEEAARLFNRLCKEVLIGSDKCYLASVFKDVNKYYDSRWHKYRAKLMRDYFSNPWSFISLLGALIIILFTVVQTSFAILAYFNPQPTSWSSF